ncbi:MAG: hypothetical protein K2Y71_25225 [Xanthobacteraceae bacterium]|nr:hypothetical protein [Xanthobacteraceae bacterium]
MPPTTAPISKIDWEPWRSALVLALFAALLATVGSRHEAWFDEAHAWLLGRDTTLWDLLAHRLHYEGTPGIWHALLWLVSHAGLPFAYLWMVSGALACIGAWIILTRAPFPYWLRVGIVFSYFLAYQYAIVARSYALDLVAIPLIAATFADRLRRPVLYGALLAFCANANTHSLIISAFLFAEFLFTIWRSGTLQWRNWQWANWPRAHLAGSALYVAAVGLALLQAWPAPDASFYEHGIEIRRGITVFVEAFVDRPDIWSASPPTVAAVIVGGLITTLLLAPSFLLFQRAGIAVLVIAVFATLIVFAIVKYANAWHAGFLYLFWIFALWVGWGALGELAAVRRRVTVASVAVIVFVHVFYTASASLRDIREPYSAGPATAQMLARADARIAALGFKTFAVQPWFGANAFANYRGGAPHDASYAWHTSEPFPAFVTPELWREAVNNRRYDVLVLSDHGLPADEIAHYVATARSAGYCAPTVVPGGLIWKSYVREADAMLVFRRCADGVAENTTRR